ncbi:MAG TPA: hypothetical protein PK992_10310, partial [Planctomycetaceae bacterium]|nr:hypothetical protein [Planctomycetaceae bacterium]
MTQIVKTQRFRFRAALLAASAVVVFLTTADCFASCGDYVYSRFHTPTQHRGTGEALTSELESRAKNTVQPHETPTSPVP